LLRILTIHPNIPTDIKICNEQIPKEKTSIPCPQSACYLQSAVYSLQSTFYTDRPGTKIPWGREGDYHIKRRGELVVPFRGSKSGFGTSQHVKPKKVHRSSFHGTFWDIEPKEVNIIYCVV